MAQLVAFLLVFTVATLGGLAAAIVRDERRRRRAAIERRRRIDRTLCHVRTIEPGGSR